MKLMTDSLKCATRKIKLGGVMTVGRMWNELTIQQRIALLESAEYKPETVAKFAPMRWGEIDRSSRINFGRIVALEYCHA